MLLLDVLQRCRAYGAEATPIFLDANAQVGLHKAMPTAAVKVIATISSLLLLANVAWGQVYWSNNVTTAQAVKVASQLKVGMWEEEVAKVLATHGLTNATSVGAKTGWSRSYGLSDGYFLTVDYCARDITTNVWGGNGLLLRAYITSNDGITINSITLTNLATATDTLPEMDCIFNPRVTITNLLAHMKDYRGKRVEVTGYYRSNMELSALFQNQEDAKNFRFTNSLWIEPMLIKPGHEKKVRFVKEGMVRVVGVFDYRIRQEGLGIGPDAEIPAQIVVLELFEKIK
jgi:hypothetical protein